jgi:hypothetical protein
MAKKNESPIRPTTDELWADVHRQLAAIQKTSYDEGFEAAKKDRQVEPHEVGELLKDLSVMESHYNTAMGHLQKLKTRLDEVKTMLMKKK